MASASDLVWDVVATLPDVASAHVLATMIRGEGVPAMVVTDSFLLGEARRSDVRVPQGLARRAHWLMSQAQFTDAELTFLAMESWGVTIMPSNSLEPAPSSNNRFERSRG